MQIRNQLKKTRKVSNTQFAVVTYLSVECCLLSLYMKLKRLNKQHSILKAQIRTILTNLQTMCSTILGSFPEYLSIKNNYEKDPPRPRSIYCNKYRRPGKCRY